MIRGLLVLGFISGCSLNVAQDEPDDAALPDPRADVDVDAVDIDVGSLRDAQLDAHVDAVDIDPDAHLDAQLDAHVDAVNIDPDADVDAQLDAHVDAVDIDPDAHVDAQLDAHVDAVDIDPDAQPDAAVIAPVFCADIEDQTLLDLVYENGPKAPAGFYSDPAEANGSPQWRIPCSPDLAESRRRAEEAFGPQMLTGDRRSTEWFHEVDVRLAGGHLLHVRNTRCDWFDGAVLAGAPHESFEPLAFLAGYLWYTQFHNLHGAHVVGGNGAIGNAANFYALCHMQFVGGDFGLCDEITLRERRYRIGIFDGEVTELADEALRQVRGRCN